MAKIRATSADDPETYAIIGAAMAVHRELGDGFLETVYHEALAIELAERSIPYQSQKELIIFYKGKPLSCHYKADLLCHGNIIVELKAVSDLNVIREAQIIHYLKATRHRRGLLINFGTSSLQVRRFVND